MKQNYFIGLLIIVLLGSVLRIWNAGSHGIWFDEKCSVLEANGISFSALSEKPDFHNTDVKEFFSVKNVVHASISVDGGNGILYALVLHGWISIFGPGDFSIRFISIFFGIALIIMVWFFVIRLTGNRKLALLLAFLIALHPLLIAYSQQARSYSMATFFSFAASFLFLSIINRVNLSRPFFSYAAYAFCVVVSLLSHYQSVYIFLGHALIMLLFVRDKKTWINILFVFFIVVICMGTWYFSGGNEGLKIIASRNETYKMILRQYNGNTFIMPANLKNSITGWFQVLLHLTGNSIQWSGLHIRFVGPLLIIPLLFMITGFRYRRKINNNKLVFSLFILFLFAPLYASILSLISGHTISFQPLYSIFSVPYTMFVIAAGFIFWEEANEGVKRLMIRSLGILWIVIMIISLKPVMNGTYINSINERKTNPYVNVAEQLSRNAETGDTIIFPSLIDAQLTNIYMVTSDQVSQKVDTSFPGKFFLLKKNGQRLEIQDFKTNNLYY